MATTPAQTPVVPVITPENARVRTQEFLVLPREPEMAKLRFPLLLAA